MAQATSLPGAPAFFGRLPLLLSEQKHFDALLGSLRELCAALEVRDDALPVRLEPAQLVEELGALLADHFQGAEDCLTTVASRRRDLLPAVVDLRSDHAMLSRALVDLRLIAMDRARWSELPNEIAALLGKLAVHRESEAALIRAAVVANVA